MSSPLYLRSVDPLRSAIQEILQGLEIQQRFRIGLDQAEGRLVVIADLLPRLHDGAPGAGRLESRGRRRSRRGPAQAIKDTLPRSRHRRRWRPAADDAAAMVDIDGAELEIPGFEHEIEIGLVGDAAPGTREELRRGQLPIGRSAIMHDDRTLRRQQAARRSQMPPRLLIVVEGIDQDQVIGHARCPERGQLRGDLRAGAAKIDRQPVIKALRAAYISRWEMVNRPRSRSA